MYHNILTFNIIGGERLRDALSAVTPPEDCSFRFTVSEEYTGEAEELDAAYIFDCTEKPLPEIERGISAKYAAVVFEGAKGLTTPDAVSRWDDIWILPKGNYDEALLGAYFSRLAAGMKAAADNRKQHICFDTLINSVPDIAWYKNTEGAHLIVNDSFCAMVGKQKEDIYKKGHCYIWDATPADEEVCLSSDREIMASRRTNTFEENVITKKETLLLKSYKSPLIDINGEVFGTCGIARDVTEFKNATTEIQILLDSFPYIILLEDANQNVVSKNLVFDEYFPEYTDIIGKSSAEWKKSLDLTESTVANLREIMETTATLNGEERTLIMDVEPLLDIFYRENGKIITLADVTDERRISTRLMESELKAQAANRAKSLFLARMSHEIRTPINSVIGMNEMILRECKEHDIRNYALTSQRSAKMLLGLVNDILDFSKIESGRMEITPAKYTLSELIADVVNMNAPRAYTKELSVNVEVDPTLPSVLFGDDVRLRQIITNLLTNAVKYTNAGSVTLKVSGERSGEDLSLSVCVSDTGIGIKPENIESLFDAFKRVSDNETRTIEGTGLGLNITNTLLKLMGSSLGVKSEYGKGSQFFFTVNQKVINHAPIGEIELTAENDDNFVYTALFYAPDAKILIVDDNEINRVVFTNLLKGTKVMITEAASGAECLELTKNEHFDIIFLDHMMPGMDGIETFRRIKEDEKNVCRETPVIALTANAISGARESYLSEGFTDFLAKPVSPLKLEQMTMKYLPQELLKAVEVVEEQQRDILPEISGFNFDIARLYSKSDEAVKESLAVFGNELIKARALLGHYLPAVEESEEALDLFRIQAHALKGAAALVGATQVSELAKTAEFAAKANNIARIKAITPILIEETEQCLKNLKEAGVCEKRPAAPPINEVAQKIDQLAGFIKEFDLDGADKIMNELYGFDYPAETRTKIEILKIASENCDGETIEKIADELKA